MLLSRIAYGLFKHVYLLHLPPSYYASWLSDIRGFYLSLPEDSSQSVHHDRHHAENPLHPLVSQWKAMSGISCVVLTSVVAVLQIANTASNPLISTLGITIFAAAFTSVFFCASYTFLAFRIIKRSHIRSWIDDIQSPSASKWEDPALLLAAPAAWLIWSCILLYPFLLSFTWSNQLDPGGTISMRILCTMVILSGAIHLWLAVPMFKKLGATATPAAEDDQEINRYGVHHRTAQ